jgi:glutathione synthase/RimK-type ligase-like ATP-grasp enzyme
MCRIFRSKLLEAPDKPRVLMLTRTGDSEADAVGLRLAQYGVHYIRIDADCLSDTMTLTLHDSPECQTPSFKVSSQNLDELSVIWLRHFDTTSITSPAEDAIVESFIRAEWGSMVQSLSSLLTSPLWINHPQAIGRLDRISQLKFARLIGLPTPETLVSNDLDSIRSFLRSTSGKLVAKVLGSHFLELKPGVLHGVFPRIITESNLESLSGANLVPCIYQEYIPHMQEVRVTIAGRKVAAVAVTKAEPASLWECPKEVFVQEYDLPSEILEKLINFMGLTDLEYGAFDLLLDDEGKYVFLEVNPTGDWVYFESQGNDTSTKITDKVASFIVEQLEGRSS